MHSDALVAGYRFNDLKRSRIISSAAISSPSTGLWFPQAGEDSARARMVAG